MQKTHLKSKVKYKNIERGRKNIIKKSAQAKTKHKKVMDPNGEYGTWKCLFNLN